MSDDNSKPLSEAPAFDVGKLAEMAPDFDVMQRISADYTPERIMAEWLAAAQLLAAGLGVQIQTKVLKGNPEGQVDRRRIIAAINRLGVVQGAVMAGSGAFVLPEYAQAALERDGKFGDKT